MKPKQLLCAHEVIVDWNIRRSWLKLTKPFRPSSESSGKISILGHVICVHTKHGRTPTTAVLADEKKQQQQQNVYGNSLFVLTEAAKGVHTQHDTARHQRHVLNRACTIFSVRACKET